MKSLYSSINQKHLYFCKYCYQQYKPVTQRTYESFYYSQLTGNECSSSRKIRNEAQLEIKEYQSDIKIPVKDLFANSKYQNAVGVFWLYDDKQVLQYVQHSRNIQQDVKDIYSRVGEDRISGVSMQQFDNNDIATDENLKELVDTYLLQLNDLPPGNNADKELFQPAKDTIVSPFSELPPINQFTTPDQAPTTPMTPDTVNTVLDQVRPYLINDGGDVEVVAVEDGKVLLKLQGACGNCPSSSVTMKMGIERVLKEEFGEQLAEVVQVEEEGSSTDIAAVEGLLAQLRPAIVAYDGSVAVESVANGVVTLKYKGPAPIGFGIQAAVKEKFDDVREVKLID